MKKLICLILALACSLGVVVGFTSCGGEKDETPAIFEIAKTSAPTKIITQVDYTDSYGQDLDGYYEMQIEGNNSIFEFEYSRYRTVEEGVAEGNTSRIKTVAGVVYFKDGKTSTDGEKWDSEAVTAVDIKFNLDPALLTDATISDDGTVLTATIAKDKVAEVLGTDLSTGGDVTLEVKTNGTYLTFVTVSCTTISGGSMVVRTSYSYNAITLEFPEA